MFCPVSTNSFVVIVRSFIHLIVFSLLFFKNIRRFALRLLLLLLVLSSFSIRTRSLLFVFFDLCFLCTMFSVLLPSSHLPPSLPPSYPPSLPLILPPFLPPFSLAPSKPISCSTSFDSHPLHPFSPPSHHQSLSSSHITIVTDITVCCLSTINSLLRNEWT